YSLAFVYFFFQAEDGIRDRNVTGVQTCALPISGVRPLCARPPRRKMPRITRGRDAAMEFLLTRRVKVSAQWSSEPLRRALARFDRDLEMTLNAGDLVPAGRIALVLARQLPPEQFIIDLQSADSMVI